MTASECLMSRPTAEMLGWGTMVVQCMCQTARQRVRAVMPLHRVDSVPRNPEDEYAPTLATGVTLRKHHLNTAFDVIISRGQGRVRV